MLSFSFQHVHVTDRESAAEWVDGILNERILSIEFFVGENRCFGSEINASDLDRLSYEFLEKYTGFFGREKLFRIANNFKVRGWSGENDFDGYFVQKDDEIHIRIVPKA